jgi:DNA topoisomerase I
VTLETALQLLALPRNLGTHPETERPVKVGLGRFGPYVVHDQGKDGQDFRSLKSEDSLFTISLERALELLAIPKTGRGRRASAKAALRELGKHPEDGEPINIYDGPYGPYIKYGKTNASLPEGATVENISLEEALKLVMEKAGTKKGGKKAAIAKTSAKAATTKAKGATKTTRAKTTKKKAEASST